MWRCRPSPTLEKLICPSTTTVLSGRRSFSVIRPARHPFGLSSTPLRLADVRTFPLKSRKLSLPRLSNVTVVREVKVSADGLVRSSSTMVWLIVSWAARSSASPRCRLFELKSPCMRRSSLHWAVGGPRGPFLKNVVVTWSVRQLTAEDAVQARRLGFEAFGVPTAPPTDPPSVDQPGFTWFGAFDADVLAARVVDREFESWFGGACLPTCGIAGVTVAAEYRGQGLLTPLFVEARRHAKQRGSLISGLFPTAARIYRRFGYELIADYVSVEVRTQALASVTPPQTARTRRARVEDFDAVRQIYDAWASGQNGPLTRRGVSFTATAEQFLDSFTGVTLAIDQSDAVCGFASWNRGPGYGEKAVIEVADLLAITGEGYRALLAALGNFVAVTPTLRIDTSGDDLARLFLPGGRLAGRALVAVHDQDLGRPWRSERCPLSGRYDGAAELLDRKRFSGREQQLLPARRGRRTGAVHGRCWRRPRLHAARAGAALRRGPVDYQPARRRPPLGRRCGSRPGLGCPLRRPSAAHPRLLLNAREARARFAM